MAISASGLYGLTLEKFFNFTTALTSATSGLESETAFKGALVLDAYTHDYDVHDFWNDVSANEVTGTTGYTAGGNTLTTTEITVGSPSAGVLKYDHDDLSWANSTIPNAMALVGYRATGTGSTSELVYLLDFVTAVSTSNGLLTVQIAANGVFNLDYTP